MSEEIPVQVQLVGRPDTRHPVGSAPDDLTPAELSEYLGMAPGNLVKASVLTYGVNNRYWRLVVHEFARCLERPVQLTATPTMTAEFEIDLMIGVAPRIRKFGILCRAKGDPAGGRQGCFDEVIGIMTPGFPVWLDIDKLLDDLVGQLELDELAHVALLRAQANDKRVVQLRQEA